MLPWHCQSNILGGEPCVDVSEQEKQAKYIVRQNYIAVKINMTYSLEITSKRDMKGRFC